MNLKPKTLYLCLLLLVLAMAFAGCTAEASPYQHNDAQGYSISVRYDANGGFFTTNTSVIVDSYDPSALPQQNGKVSVALLPTDDPARGNDAFAPVKSGYFLAGWYAERTETADGYTYGKKWDFAKDRLELDAAGSYSAAEPVLTLYAAWVPLFQVEFYQAGTGEYLDAITFDPTQGTAFQIPDWNEETGAMEMHKFPERSGYTFQSVSYDQEGKETITGTVEHPGKVDEATGTAQDPVLKLYVDWREGEWYRIYNVDQFIDNASLSGSYEIYADLDFSEAIWPTVMMYGNYTGTIQGNGHSFSNISAVQTNNSKVNAGLFGVLADTAAITDLKLENVTFTIQAGTRVVGTSYGLFAGAVSAEAEVSGVTITNSVLQVDSDCYFGTDEYVVGLICGTGETAIDPSGIATEAVGSAPENVTITVEGQDVSVEIALS